MRFSPWRVSRPESRWLLALVTLVLTLLPACRLLPSGEPATAPRRGDEIVVAGRYFHTGTHVVTWQDPGGYDAYRPLAGTPAAGGEPDNFGARHLDPDAKPAPGAPPLSLPDLRRLVDQLVLHYDDCGASKWCFTALQHRRLSVHFLLDVDGTIYQTLDLRERAYHATTANNRSIGIEIANIGAFPPGPGNVLASWYRRDATGRVRLAPPPDLGPPGTLTPDFVARPAREQPVTGVINGHLVEQYDYTPEQYAALIKLAAALHRIFPRLKLDYPHDSRGRPIPGKLPDAGLDRFQGILGHYHVQDNKLDPGPAFQWDTLIAGARQTAAP